MEKHNEIPETLFSFENEEAYKIALKAAPAREWVKSRSLGSKSSKYLPIYILTAIADRVFQEWDVVDEDFKIVHNEIVYVVKIQYTPSYPGASIRTCTGVGAKPIQCDANSVPSSFPKGKKANALEYNAPAARASAISNALNTLGNVFGRNLNRDTSNNYTMDKKEK